MLRYRCDRSKVLGQASLCQESGAFVFMLSFSLFKTSDNQPSGWAIAESCGSYALGGDGMAADVAITLQDDQLVCTRKAGEPVAIVVPYRTEALSPEPEYALPDTLWLRTCLLPGREKPYLLNLELARHRIMTFLTKLEDWSLFDLSGEHPVMQRFVQAQQLFTDALVACPSDADAQAAQQADRLARQALCQAIIASRDLAIESARRSVSEGSGEVGARPGDRTQIGCAVRPGLFDDTTRHTVERIADFLCMPMRWVDMEPREGSYAFGPTDRWIEWAIRTAHKPVVAGPVVNFSKANTPEWLYIWENDYETLRDLMHEHTRHIVTRYRRTVTRWTVASGLHLNSNFRFDLDQIMDLTSMCVSLVRKLQPKAVIQLGIEQPFGEYFATNRASIPPLLYADMVLQAGVRIDALAVEVDLAEHEPLEQTGARPMRDELSISCMLDRIGALDRPVFVSLHGLDENLTPGRLERLACIARIIAAKSFVQGVCWYDLNSQSMKSTQTLDLLADLRSFVSSAARSKPEPTSR